MDIAWYPTLERRVDGCQVAIVTDFAISVRKIAKSRMDFGFPVMRESRSRPLTVPAGEREIVNHLI
jgi:hypothetical protein